MRTATAMYSWSIPDGAGGVSSDRRSALTELIAALLDAPLGSQGTVDRVELDPVKRASYVHRDRVAGAWRDPDHGAVRWKLSWTWRWM